MSAPQAINPTRNGWKVLRTILVLLALSLLGLIGVQLADVSITDTLTADLMVVAWVTQAAALVWMLVLRVGRVPLGWSLVGLLGFEAGWALLLLVCVPWQMLSAESLESPVKARRFARPAGNVPTDLDETSPQDWPGFRGARRDGRVAGVKLAPEWPVGGPREIWRHDVGAGWSSFAVVGDYCFTQEQRGEFEAVVCYEIATGRECWKHLDPGRFHGYPGGLGDHGPRATPTVDRQRVYTLGAFGVLNCLDASSGEVLWSLDILSDNDTNNRQYGMCGSPLVVDDLVIVSPGGRGCSLVAYDALSGDKVWSGGDDQGSYSSPHPAVIGGRRQVLILSGDSLSGHRLEDGEVMWRHPWVSNPDEKNNVCQPVVLPLDADGASRIFISSGYGQGCALLEVTRTGEHFDVEEVWGNRNLKAKFTSVVQRNGFIYGLDERILVCLDLATGERRWKQGRYGFGQLILVDDLLLIQAESGDVALARASPAGFEELARFSPLSGRTWNHPVVVGSRLLVRNAGEAACYELPLADQQSN